MHRNMRAHTGMTHPHPGIMRTRGHPRGVGGYTYREMHLEIISEKM
jgi:hypothetical protein